MKRILALAAVAVIAAVIAIGVSSCGSSHKPPTGPVCSYDADDRGCPPGITTPDNDGNR